MGELIAENLTEYKDKAIYLGKNLDKLLNIKKKIKNNNMEKSLFDSRTYTKDLEKAFNQIYKTKKNKLQNKDLRVNQL
jgi:predicted O-linked N-acetylglucosamine transferase (SPINDLY family)